MDEENLLVQLGQKDEYAIQQLVKNYQQMVFTTSMGFVHNEHDAADITQDVFIKFYESAHTYRGDAKISTWLYRITVNTSLNFIRDQRKHQSGIPLHDIGQAGTDDAVAERGLEEEQLKKTLDQALRKLPKRQHSVFVLHKYNDLSYNEIAEIEGITLSAVESLLHRAKMNLQKYLKAFYEKNYK